VPHGRARLLFSALNLKSSLGMEASGRIVRRGLRSMRAIALSLLSLACGGCISLHRHRPGPDSLAACRQLSREGVAALEQGDNARAQALLEEAVAAGPSDVDARRQLAEVMWQTGAKRDAVVHMESAVRLDPRHAPTLMRAGEMMLGLGAVDEALERAERALALDATLPGAWALRGRVFRAQKENDRALADFQQALRYNPRAPDVLLEVAELQFQLGRPQRSLTTVQYLLDSYPRGEEPQRALWLQGLAFGAVDRKQDAVASLYAASTHGPAQSELLYQLARAQSAAGDPVAAAATARQALAADGNHQGSRALLAQLEHAGGDAPMRR
jgi:tetratricopeptide (TPR) repeat protein